MTSRGNTAATSVQRLATLDAARGAAIVFMILAHTWVFVRAMTPTMVDRVVSILSTTASPLFALIIGVTLGMNLRSVSHWSRKARNTYAVSYAAKAVLLIGLGILLDLKFSGAAIVLQYLGWAMLFLAALMFLRKWILLVTAGIALLGGPFISQALTNWRQTNPLEYLQQPELLRNLVDWTFVGHNYRLTGLLPLMLIGLVLATADFHRGYRVITLTAAGAGIATAGYVVLKTQANHGVSFRGSWGENIFDLGLALGSCSLIFWIYTGTVLAPLRRPAQVVLHPVRAQGTMALTIYALHILILMLVWASDWVAVGGLLRGPTLAFTEPINWIIPVGLVVGCALFALAWRRWVGIGPVEFFIKVTTGWIRVAPTATATAEAADRDLDPVPSG